MIYIKRAYVYNCDGKVLKRGYTTNIDDHKRIVDQQSVLNVVRKSFFHTRVNKDFMCMINKDDAITYLGYSYD